MKAIRIHAYGGPEVLQLDEVPIPSIQSGEVLVRVHAAGVNFLDVYQRTGLYKTVLPFIPGMEGAGIIEKAGPETSFKPGTRVAWTQHPGAYAEFDTGSRGSASLVCQKRAIKDSPDWRKVSTSSQLLESREEGRGRDCRVPWTLFSP